MLEEGFVNLAEELVLALVVSDQDVGAKPSLTNCYPWIDTCKQHGRNGNVEMLLKVEYQMESQKDHLMPVPAKHNRIVLPPVHEINTRYIT